MKHLRLILRVGLILSLSLAPLAAQAETVVVPQLVIRQVKVSGDEMVVLQATQELQLSDYWLGYTSTDGVNPHTVVPTMQLPNRELATGEALMLLTSYAESCDAVMMAKLPFDFAVSKGTLVVRKLSSPVGSNASTFTTIDSVHWSKPSSASAATTATLDLRKESGDTALWYHDPSFTKPWRVGNLANCTLTLAPQTSAAATEIVAWERTATEPPAIIENINEVEATPDETSIPGDNAGLAPPLITELLPNPAGTGTDSTDEYIELYNGNEAPFYLSGFTLQTGLTTKHSYIFPTGVSIPAKSFRAFNASQTGLSMSNTSGQAAILDGSGMVVAQSDPYDSAPDGQAWALANGTWYWTTKPTEAATNVIAQPITLQASAIKKVVKAATTAKVKSASTTAKKATKATSTKSKDTATTPAKQVSALPKPTAVHPGVLALVAACAVGYGAYVYRKDLANAFAKLRRH